MKNKNKHSYRKPELGYAAPLDTIDSVVFLSESRIVTKKYLSPDADYFKGHYPHEPIFPGIFFIESIVQAMNYYSNAYNQKHLLAHVKSMRFFSPLKPKDTFLNENIININMNESTVTVASTFTKNELKVAQAKTIFSSQKEHITNM